MIPSRCSGRTRATVSRGIEVSIRHRRQGDPTAKTRAQSTPRRSRRARSSSSRRSRRHRPGAEGLVWRPRSSTASRRRRVSPGTGGMSRASGTSSAPTRNALCLPRWDFAPTPPPTHTRTSPPLANAAGSNRRQRRARKIPAVTVVSLRRPIAASCRPSFAPAPDASVSPRISMPFAAKATRASAISRRLPQSPLLPRAPEEASSASIPCTPSSPRTGSGRAPITRPIAGFSIRSTSISTASPISRRRTRHVRCWRKAACASRRLRRAPLSTTARCGN